MITPMASILTFILLSMSYISTKAQDRAPHGLLNERPMAFSPSAFEFFHPKSEYPTSEDCAKSSCSPLPMAATVGSTIGHESKSVAEESGSKVGAAALVGIGFGFVFVVLLAMGFFYFVVTRRANISRANSVKPGA